MKMSQRTGKTVSDKTPVMAAAKNFVIKRRKFLIVAAAFCLLGGALLMRSHAASFVTAIEAESGQLSGNFGSGPTAGASGGASVTFGASGGGNPSPSPSPNPTPTPTPTPPASDGVTAAATFNWGTPAKSDDMNDLSGWGTYDDAGNQFGKRSSGQISVSGGIATIKGEPGGKTGGMAMKYSQYQGRWEVREKVGGAASCWRPVLLTWPDAEDWPVGGEVDYAENGGGDLGHVNFFLHYGSSNSQSHGSTAVDMTQWHNYAFEWTADHIRGYVDGKQFFEDTNTGHLPPRSMHQTVQLDGSQGCGGTTQQMVDWVRVYKLN